MKKSLHLVNALVYAYHIGMISEEIPKLIELAVARGFSLREVSEATGISVATLSQVRTLSREPTMRVADALVEFADCRLTKPKISRNSHRN